ncbi:ABC transporter permease [Telmatobacter bradus]|uniref:ABC transporter permease n=1 Tax=Telmatobacter bradus TaxID=474953 RepID=UPI003B42F297
MRNILLIARREYLEQVRGKAFRISTVLVPLSFVVILGILFLMNKQALGGKHLVIASNDAQLAADVLKQYDGGKDAGKNGPPDRMELLAPATDSDRAALVERVRNKQIDGFLWIDHEPGQEPTAVYDSLSSSELMLGDKLESALNRAILRERLNEHGIDAATANAVLKRINLDTRQISKDGREVQSNTFSSFFKGYFMAILLLMTTMLYGLNVARSIIQEKTSRIFEVMLSIAKPSDMLAGKLIGTGLVGLTQLAIWLTASMALAGSAFAAPLLTGKLSLHFSVLEVVLFALYFVLGYLFNAVLFAGLAASCETEQELQLYTPLAAVPAWVGFGMISVVTNNPNSALSVAGSLFPATSPIIMMLRMGGQMPPLWQIAASIALLGLSIWALLWFSARLYRVGILMYGKRATLPEMLRWLRYN